MLKPTEDVKVVNDKINNSITFMVEHLLSYECWRHLKNNNWVEERKQTEMFNMFNNVMDKTKSLNSTIKELVENEDLRETIISYIPKDEKKKQILKFVGREVASGNVSILQGFQNTINMLEKEFK